MFNNLRIATIAGGIALAAGNSQALPLRTNSTVQIQASGIGAITNLGTQNSSQLNVQLQQRNPAGNSGNTNAMAQGGARIELRTGLQASFQQQHLNNADLQGFRGVNPPQPQPAQVQAMPTARMH